MTYKQEKITPYNNTQEKGEQVEQMFDNIAHSYDKLNHRLSWNIDKAWRKMALNRLKPFKPQHILDVATGTGDFAIQAATMLNPKQVVGADISEGMMNIGRQKVENLGLSDTISFSKEDCMNLSVPICRDVLPFSILGASPLVPCQDSGSCVFRMLLLQRRMRLREKTNSCSLLC